MNHPSEGIDFQGMPLRLQMLLSHFDLSRAFKTRDGFVVPNPTREDNHPSVRVTIAEDGRILLVDRTGTPTTSILHFIGAKWSDLLPDENDELEMIDYAKSYLSGGARGGGGRGNAPAPSEEVVQLRHQVYSCLLQQLQLHTQHHEYMIGRGFTNEAIEIASYRSLRRVKANKIKEQILAEFGEIALSVPGIEAMEPTGLLIPVRGVDGRIFSLKVRDPLAKEKRKRYSYFGEGNVLACHHPVGFPKESRSVAVTEGELKADKETFLKHLEDPIFAVPGMSNWPMAFATLQAIGAKEVAIVFDRGENEVEKEQIQANVGPFEAELLSKGYDLFDYPF